MKNTISKLLLLMLLTTIAKLNYGQTSSSKEQELSFTLQGDTLYSNSGSKFFKGQKLIVVKAAGVNGQFRSIVSKKAAIVPSIWGQNKNYENAIENYVDSKQEKEKVKNTLINGTILTIDKISYAKGSKPNFYLVALISDIDKYKCDLKLALTLGELIKQE
jgi:hypothetical protein